MKTAIATIATVISLMFPAINAQAELQTTPQATACRYPVGEIYHARDACCSYTIQFRKDGPHKFANYNGATHNGWFSGQIYDIGFDTVRCELFGRFQDGLGWGDMHFRFYPGMNQFRGVIRDYRNNYTSTMDGWLAHSNSQPEPPPVPMRDRR